MTSKEMMTRRSALAVGVLGIAGGAAAENVGTTGTEHILARNKAQVKRWYGEIFGTYDISKAHEVISPKLTTNNRPSTGDAIKELPTFFKWAKAHFDEVETVQEQFIAEGNWVARRYTLKLIYYPGGNAGEENAYKGKVTIKGMGFYEFDENGLMIQNIHIENENPKFSKIDAEHAEKKQ